MKKITETELVIGKQIKNICTIYGVLHIIFTDDTFIVFDSMVFNEDKISTSDNIIRVEEFERHMIFVDSSEMKNTDYSLVLIGAISKQDFNEAKQNEIIHLENLQELKKKGLIHKKK